jgi:hypothetical protein
MQRARFGERVRRLCHRQCRQQFDWAADGGGIGRAFRRGDEFLCVRRAQPCWRGVGVRHHHRHAPDARRDGYIAFDRDPFAPRQPRAAHGICDRVFDPVRVHRGVHLYQFRARARAVGGNDDGRRLRVFRLPAVDHYNATCGRSGGPHWSTQRNVGRLCLRAGRAAAHPRTNPAWRTRGHGSDRVRDLLRASGGDRLCERIRARPSWRGKRALSRKLLPRRHGRYGWSACVGGVAVALLLACVLAAKLRAPALA